MQCDTLLSMRPRLLSGAVGLVLLAAGAAPASAQAWADETGELSLTLGSAFQFSRGVYYGDAGLLTGLPAQSLRSTVGADYTPIEGLTVEAAITAQLDRYSGPESLPPPSRILLAHGTQDDGDWHGNVTDADLRARYQLVDGVVALAPVVLAKIPVTDYEVTGYAASGTGLVEIGGGLFVGKAGLFVDDLFGQLGYTFTWVQKEDGGGDATREFSTHHSDASLLLGYAITPKLSTVGGAELRWTHGGVEAVDIETLDPVVQMWHDPILKRKYVALSAGAAYGVTRTLELSGMFGAVIWGDSVSDAKTISLDLSWATDLAN